MVMSRMAWWRWILKNWLPKQSRQWKGKSSGASRTQEGSRCADDVGGRGGSKRRIRRDLVYSVFEGGPEGVLAVESPARFAEPEPRALKHGVLGPNCTRLEPILRMSRRSAQRCWMWRCVLRVVIVRLPGAAGVRNLPRSSHHCSHCKVKSPGSA